MEKNIIVPLGHAVAVLSTRPTVAHRIVDGISVYLNQFHKRAKIAPLDHEWELLLESAEEPQYRLIDQRGYENLDTRPVEIPLDLRTTPTLRDQVVEQVARYLAARAVDDEYETLEEAHDFDVQGELDDIATEAETAFLAAFAPHEGRAANDQSRGVPAIPDVGSEGLKPPVVPKTGKKSEKFMTEETPRENEET